MSMGYNVKTKERPNLARDLQPGDTLHIGTEEGGEIFTVTKISDREYLFIQCGHETGYVYSRGVVNQKIMDFDSHCDALYMKTKGNLETES